MELLLLGLFSLSLLLCVFTGQSILLAMVFGYLLFFGYGLLRGKSARQMLGFSLSGIRTVKNILLTFLLIGLITAVWRACGSIAYIVYYASVLCTPALMLLATFLLCSGISFLTGTAFGSAATIGVICTTMANSMGVPILYTGGAVLAGVFFGDRCSPVSTSALLVSELTRTDLFGNLRRMAASAVVPYALSCLLYLLLGRGVPTAAAAVDSTRTLFRESYRFSPWVLLPVAVVLVFACLRIRVKTTLAVSALCGMAVTVLLQGTPLGRLPALCLFGFHSGDPALDALMAGGGIRSMVRVFCIVCISSCYSGIFRGTGFLTRIQALMVRLDARLTPFGTLLLTALLTSAIACNQTLAIMLTDQLCSGGRTDPEGFALDLENSVVVIAPLIPWSIASGVPLASVGAPVACIGTAFYLYLLPLWSLAVRLRQKKSV